MKTADFYFQIIRTLAACCGSATCCGARQLCNVNRYAHAVTLEHWPACLIRLIINLAYHYWITGGLCIGLATLKIPGLYFILSFMFWLMTSWFSKLSQKLKLFEYSVLQFSWAHRNMVVITVMALSPFLSNWKCEHFTRGDRMRKPCPPTLVTGRLRGTDFKALVAPLAHSLCYCWFSV